MGNEARKEGCCEFVDFRFGLVNFFWSFLRLYYSSTQLYANTMHR